MNQAGFLMRVLALIIDVIIFAAAAFLLGLLFKMLGVGDFSIDTGKQVHTYSPLEILSIFMVPLLIAFEVFTAGTPGKIILGLSICKQSGEAAGWLQLLWRAVLKYPIVVGMFAGIPLMLSPVLIMYLTDPNFSMASKVTSPLYMNMFFLGVTILQYSLWMSTIAWLGCWLALFGPGLALHDIFSGTAVFHGSPFEKPTKPQSNPPPSFGSGGSKSGSAVDSLIFR